MEENRKNFTNIKKIIVHDGSFHADDVMCAALMKYLNPDIEIERTREVPDECPADVVIADVGGGKYDHHSQNAPLREDGKQHSACGLLLADCWQDIFPMEGDYKSFNKRYIMPIENQDNGIKRNPLSNYISSFMPVWDGTEDVDEAFARAVDVCVDLIRRDVESAKAKARATPIVERALQESDGVLVILDEYAPYEHVLMPSSAQYVIYPDKSGGYHLRCIHTGRKGNEVKHRLPVSWKKSPPAGCSFVHDRLFLAAFDTLEDAVCAVQTIYARPQIVKTEVMDVLNQMQTGSLADGIGYFYTLKSEDPDWKKQVQGPARYLLAIGKMPEGDLIFVRVHDTEYKNTVKFQAGGESYWARYVQLRRLPESDVERTDLFAEDPEGLTEQLKEAVQARDAQAGKQAGKKRGKRRRKRGKKNREDSGDSGEEFLDVLTPEGEQTGEARPRDEIHQDGTWHASVHIWIVDGDQVLLQKRSEKKESSPGLYDMSAAGHVRTGESPLQAAVRETKEEIGLALTEEQLHLLTVQKLCYRKGDFVSNEYNYVYIAFIPRNSWKIRVQTEEVAETRWMSLSELSRELKESPSKYCMIPEEVELILQYCQTET